MASLPKVCEAFSLPVQSRLRRCAHQHAPRLLRPPVPRARREGPQPLAPHRDQHRRDRRLPRRNRRRFPRPPTTYSPSSASTKSTSPPTAPAPGTFADHRQPDDVPAAIKSERLHAVEDLQRQVSSEINSTYLLQDVDVIVEQSKPADDPANERLTGRTRTMKLVHFDAPRRPLPARRPPHRHRHPHRRLVAPGHPRQPMTTTSERPAPAAAAVRPPRCRRPRRHLHRRRRPPTGPPDRTLRGPRGGPLGRPRRPSRTRRIARPRRRPQARRGGRRHRHLPRTALYLRRPRPILRAGQRRRCLVRPR